MGGFRSRAIGLVCGFVVESAGINDVIRASDVEEYFQRVYYPRIPTRKGSLPLKGISNPTEPGIDRLSGPIQPACPGVAPRGQRQHLALPWRDQLHPIPAAEQAPRPNEHNTWTPSLMASGCLQLQPVRPSSTLNLIVENAE